MSTESIIYGYIEGALVSPDGGHVRRLQRLNREVIRSLPRVDEWPYLSRSMFSAPGERYAEGTYRGQVVHFGASMKSIEEDWPVWFAKFESLLRRMYWLSAAVHFSPEWGGPFEYRWEVDPAEVDGYLLDPPRPPNRWKFSPGPMKFVAYGVDSSDEPVPG